MQGLPVLMKEQYGPNLQRYRLALRKIDFGVQCHYMFLHGAFYPEGGVMMQACQAAASLVLHYQCNGKGQQEPSQVLLGGPGGQWRTW